MKNNKFIFLLFLFSFQVFSQSASDIKMDADIKALDTLVTTIISGEARYGSLGYFIEYFEKCASDRHNQARAAYLHRVDRKNFTKRYNIEIEYSYYKSMSKLMKELEPLQNTIDKSQSVSIEKPRVSIEELSRAKSEWKVLSSHLSSIHKKFMYHKLKK